MKQHTIIFVPHARAKFRKWRLSSLQVGLLLGSLAFLTIGGLVATFYYFSSTVDRDKLERLQAETAELQAVNSGFESSIEDLERQVEDYQQRIHRLAIVAGLSELSPEAGIGGPDDLTADADLSSRMAFLENRLQKMGDGMDVLQDKFDEHRLLTSAMPAISPVKGLLTSGFNYRRDPFTGKRAFHQGIDIVAPRGKEIRATGNGIVTKAGWAVGLGNTVFISHGFGLVTRYGHMSKVLVEVGQQVERGETIGLVGSSGRSTGNHVHYEVHLDGKPTNPLGYILDDPRP